MRVIAIACDGEPLDRTCVDLTGKLAYVVNSSTGNANRISEKSGVGFPRWSVFKFDSGIWDQLSSAYAHQNAADLASLKEVLEPI